MAAGCSDVAGPTRRAHRAPAFATGAPTSIALDQRTATLGETSTMLGAGFYPTNPKVGDAIVATFFWQGSTNIIQSVTDRLSNGTAVGNTYNLVDYVTAGGVSQATYVATNVGNFPSPNADQTTVLVVQATLSAQVTGGVMLSAYNGVAQGAAQALGAHSHGSGTASTTTVADPGSVTVGVGALTYGVTFANELAGVGPPANSQNIATTSDASTKADGEYLAPAAGAGSVDPQWTWFFNSAGTWLATALVLNPPATPPGPATRLTFTGQPSTTPAGGTISPAVQVAAQDAAGNTDATFSGSVTISLGTNPSAGTLSGTLTVTAVNGVATFSNLSIDQPGSGYTLQVAASALTGATSSTFTVAARGIVLDQWNGTMAQGGLTKLVKGFNPTNPHLGDAIVATFFWVGSTNVITSVTDHLTNSSFTLVGNTYHLVEYVTAGGISMATYVATNVQNFPDPNPDQGSVLAVEADLSSSVPDGGLLLSAYSGVGADFTRALGQHHPGSGAGSTQTVADAGTIALGAGALAYAVSLSNGFVGETGPSGFKTIATMSEADQSLKDDGEFTVLVSGGSVDPQWTWYFNAPSTWLTTVLALNPGGTAPAPGNVTVTTSTSGSSLPTSGYSVALDGGATQAIPINGSVTFSSVAAGSHTVVLSGVPGNCTVSGGMTQTVTVPSGGTATAPYNITCTTPSGNLTVTTSTSGSSLPSSGYSVAVDGGTAQSIAINGSLTFSNLAAGSHTVVLSGVPGNCTVSGGTTQTVTVPSGGTATAPYSVTCTTPPGNLMVTTSTSGTGLPTSGYSVTVDGGAAQPIPINGSLTFTSLAAGSHTVVLSGVPGNCTVSGGTTQTVTVPSGGTATAPYSVSCALPATHLVFLTQPPSTILLPSSFTVQVAAVDAQGNTVSGYTGTVTIAIAHDASLFGNAHLSGTLTVSAVNGVATFSGLSIDQTGVGYTLGVSTAGLAGATSNAFSVIL